MSSSSAIKKMSMISISHESMTLPQRISHNQKCDVLLIRILQDFVRLGLDHVPIGDYELLAIESFLAKALINEFTAGFVDKGLPGAPSERGGWRCRLRGRRGCTISLPEIDMSSVDQREVGSMYTSRPRTVMSFSSHSPSPIT
jgi:hypothetical protein